MKSAGGFGFIGIKRRAQWRLISLVLLSVLMSIWVAVDAESDNQRRRLQDAPEKINGRGGKGCKKNFKSKNIHSFLKYVGLNDPVELHCPVHNRNDETIHWSLNGVPLINNERIEISSAVLSFKRFGPEDKGRYKCKIDCGDTAYFSLKLLRKPRTFQRPKSPKTSERYRSKEEDVKVEKGGKLILQCQADEKLSWTFLGNDHKFQVLSGYSIGGVQVYEKVNAGSSDSGIYTCEYIGGGLEKVFKVTVE